MKHRIKLPAPVADIYRAIADLERLYHDRACRLYLSAICEPFRLINDENLLEWSAQLLHSRYV